jgi:hypothetical protein
MKSDLPPPDPGEPSAKADDRRAHPRIPAKNLSGISASLSSDLGARLIDLSRGGALFESRRRAVPNSEVALRLMTQDGSHLVRGRVVRSRIIRMENGGMGYQTALAFNEALRDLLPDAPEATEEPAAPPPTEHADGVAAERTDVEADPTEDIGAMPHDRIADREADDAWGVTPVIVFTANIDGTSDDLRELFCENDW